VVGIVRTDLDGRITLVNQRFCEMAARSREALLGSSLLSVIHPDDQAEGHARFLQMLETATPFVLEARLLRPDGSVLWGSHAVSIALNGSGVPRHAIVLCQDVTGRREAEDRLRDSEERFRLLATNIPQLVFRSGGRGNRTWPSPQWEVFTGLSAERSCGFGWLDVIHPEDRSATMEAWRKAADTREYYVEHRVRRVDGEYRWHQTRAAPIGDAAGRDADWVGTSADVHDLRSLQERQQVLVAELQHRTRNLLGVVQAIARQTLRGSASVEDFAQEFEGRLRALSRVQGLLARTDAEALELGEIVRAELGAHLDDRSGRIDIQGPPVVLPMISVQTFALAIHELSTNALKYGALRAPAGHLSVRWKLEADASRRVWVVLEWQETGTSPPAAAARRGYGTELIERALPYQLGAKTRLAIGAGGVRCEIKLPLSRANEDPHG
jgi:PAS domain S-box-containing protein